MLNDLAKAMKALDGKKSVVKDLSLLTADVSVAFMHAPVEAEACDLVLLPANLTIKGCRVIAWLGKAMNGLRRAPLLWFLELQRVVYSMGGQDTFENTLFRLQTPNGMLLVLVYVDDLLVAAESPQEGESFLQQLQTIWRIKLTGRIPALEKGVLQFLGRTIYRERDGESTLNLGVSEAYMTGVIDSWHEKLRRVKHGIAEFWDSWRGPRCPEQICVFQFHILRDSSRSHQVQQKRVCVHCYVGC